MDSSPRSRWAAITTPPAPALIPTSSVDQYGATLAQWFGVAPGSLPAIFPNIGNFPTSNLGILG